DVISIIELISVLFTINVPLLISITDSATVIENLTVRQPQVQTVVAENVVITDIGTLGTNKLVSVSESVVISDSVLTIRLNPFRLFALDALLVAETNSVVLFPIIVQPTMRLEVEDDVVLADVDTVLLPF